MVHPYYGILYNLMKEWGRSLCTGREGALRKIKKQGIEHTMEYMEYATIYVKEVEK